MRVIQRIWRPRSSTLLNDPERAAQLGKQAAIDSQQRFSREIMAERALNCYGKAIERNRLRK